MSQPELPDDLAPTSDGERHSRERIARPTLLAKLRRRFLDATGPKARTFMRRALLAPLVLALVPLYWVADATYRASLTTVGRDQGIFYYIAWAVRHGAVDYRDVRDVNGPLVHLIHLVMLYLGAADEHRFHVLDLAATGLSFAVVGALVPGVLVRARAVERVAWAFAGWVVLAGQYALYLYWNQAQRESFSDWFLLPSLALQIGRRRERHLVWIAALSTLTWFAKPSFVLFTAVQLFAVLVDQMELSRPRRLARFALGGALGAVIPMAYLLRFGDAARFFRITTQDVPRIYRFIWARSAQEILGDEGPLSVATMGLAASALVLCLIAMRALPRRMLVLGLAPLAALAGAIAQHKGFGYHFHPLTATTHLALMVALAMLWERYRFRPPAVGRFLALGAAVLYALTIASAMRLSPHTRNVWILAGGGSPEARMDREYFDSFKSHDFFPWEIRQAARWIDDVTPPDARVQAYGMDPYLLYLAQRRSATPYIYAYDLNADAALDGGWNMKPTWPEAENIRAQRDAHEKDMLAKLVEAPPEAFVFIDRSPLITYQDAWQDFRHCCTESARWVATHYHPARSFGEVHVWLRDDLPVPDRDDEP